jgi:hypothetical protein
MKLTREQAEGHIQAGRSVAFRPKDGATRVIEKPASRKEQAAMPPEDARGTYLLLRDDKGNLTRAGMVHAIESGGSVAVDGNLFESIDDLPTEADLAKGDRQRAEQVRAGLLAQREALDKELAKVQVPEETAEASEEEDEEEETSEPEPKPERKPRARRARQTPPEGQDVQKDQPAPKEEAPQQQPQPGAGESRSPGLFGGLEPTHPEE